MMYASIKLEYNKSLVFPIEYLEHLIKIVPKAFILDTPYGQEECIRDIGTEDLIINFISEQDLKKIKLNKLISP